MSKPESNLLLEIGHTTFHAACGADSFALPLERNANGRLTEACRERLSSGLKAFVAQKARGAKNAWCAVNARGVSMRRLSLPASSPDELQRVLQLQIESEFPISPEELAWGTQPLGSNAGRQDVLVVAVKKDALEECSAIFGDCGLVARFTLAALARAEIQKPPGGLGSAAILDIGRDFSELLIFDNGAPASVRVIPWGGGHVTRAIQERLSISHDEAEKLKLTLQQPGSGAGGQSPVIQGAIEEAEAALARSLKFLPAGTRLYLTGKSARQAQMAPTLGAALGGIRCESLESAQSPSPTAAIAGLAKMIARPDTSPVLVLQAGGGQLAAAAPRSAVWKWAAAAVFLALATLLFPYAEAIALKPFLEKKLAKLEADRGRLAVIDQELDFLKFVKQNQPPYFDAIYLLVRSAPQGARLNSLAMGRHQDLSMSFRFGNSAQVSDFRTKLIESGWFANVMVEEQSQPQQDRSVNVRMTAALKPAEERRPIPTNAVDKAAGSGSGWGGPQYSDSQPPPMMMPPPSAAPMPAPAPSAGPAPMTPPGPLPGNGAAARRRARPPIPPNP